MPFVYSTATCGTTYVQYDQSSNSSAGHNKIVKKVSISGGHKLPTRQLVTPLGVVTQVSEEDLEFLLKNESFQRHMKAGFISYDKKKVEPSKKAAFMESQDQSAPLTPKDFEKSENEDENEDRNLRIYKGLPKNKR